MAGEVLYADLNILRASSSSRPPEQSQHFSSPPCPRWHRMAVGVGLAGIIILTIAVIVLGVWVSWLQISSDGQSRGALSTLESNETRTINSAKCNSSLEAFRSCLKETLCEPHNGSLAEGSRCKLCPQDWRLRGDKCYWLSKEKRAWNWSRDDCSRKSSRMLVIQNKDEMDFMQNVTHGENYIWIGLRATHPGGWTWVDGSPLDTARFSVSNSTKGNSCARLTGSRIQAEPCESELKWICQKEAAVI